MRSLRRPVRNLSVPDAILLSRRTLATIKGNLVWTFGYNTLAIPLAALGFLNPLIATSLNPEQAIVRTALPGGTCRRTATRPGRSLRRAFRVAAR